MSVPSQSKAPESIPDWVCAVLGAAGERYFSDRFHIEGLEIVLNSVDPSLVRWALRYLQPLSMGSDAPEQESCTIFCLYSDELVLEATRHFAVEDNVEFLGYAKDRALLKCAHISDTLILYCNGRGGLFWLADFESRTIFIVFSSRSKMPALDFARTVRDVVTSYLTDQGWSLYHAGAVDTPAGAVMIVGNPGAGKTSLILALVRGGARYIANEQLFVRADGDSVRVLGYPLAIAVGLGTALQFPGLSDLVENPDLMLYPRRRFSASRLARTPRSRWPFLDDKLQLLPEELDSYLGMPGVAPGGRPGGRLCALVVPQMRKKPVAPEARALGRRALSRLLSDNLLDATLSQSRLSWSQMVVQGASGIDDEGSVKRLCDMGAVRFRFSLSASEGNGLHIDMLLDAALA